MLMQKYNKCFSFCASSDNQGRFVIVYVTEEPKNKEFSLVRNSKEEQN